MKLEKAIEALLQDWASQETVVQPSYRDAVKLGIEALKRLLKEREIQGSLYNYELPGETTEEERR